jgi:hypothetical protein
MLEEYQQSLTQKKARSKTRKFLSSWSEPWALRRPAVQVSFALMFLVVGLTAGYFFHASLQSGGEIAQLRQQVQQIRQMAAVSMLRQESMSEQLRNLGWSPRAEQLDRTTLEALLQMITNDPSINLSQESPDAPLLLPDYPFINQEFIQSLSEQASPLAQVAVSLLRQIEHL